MSIMQNGTNYTAFLHVIEQNDICNLLLEKMDIANQKFSYTGIVGLLKQSSKNHHYNHVQFLNN